VQSVKLLLRDREEPQRGHSVSYTFCTLNSIYLLLQQVIATACIICKTHREQGSGFIAFKTSAAAKALIDSPPFISFPSSFSKHPICYFRMLVQPNTSLAQEPKNDTCGRGNRVHVSNVPLHVDGAGMSRCVVFAQGQCEDEWAL
jgi:hypothetical protein